MKATQLLELPTSDLTIGVDFRLDDDPEAVSELAASIAQIGVLQPLVVRPCGDGVRWEVVAGRRRLAASREAGLETVPCLVRSLTDEEAADIAFTENVHRRMLSPIEEALAFARLRKQGLDQKAIVARTGRSVWTVSVYLRLLDMPEALQQKVHRGEMTVKTAYDRFRRVGAPRPGRGTHGALDGETAALVTHWRRRHDRLLAGIAQILKNRPADGLAFRQQLERLLSLDRQPLPEPTRPTSSRVA